MNWPAFAIGLLPEHLLLAGVLLLIVHALVARSGQGAAAIALLTVGAAALAALWLALTGFEGEPFIGQVSVSRSTSLGKVVVLSLAWPVLLLARDDLGDGGPFYPLLVSSLYGLALMLSSDSFLTLFLGLELMSLPVYVLVLLGLKRQTSPEAALKYLVLGGAATATLLMGISLLYGHAGMLALVAFPEALARSATATAAAGGGAALAGVVLVLLAFFLKAAIVPFHAWAPDAYEGASLPVTAYMAAIVKAGVLLAALRLFGASSVPGVLVGLVAVLPLASIAWGNLAAMRQPNLRRMMAYSSIAHAGYLFLAFLGDAAGRFTAVWFYLLAYGLMTMLAFSALPAHGDDSRRDRIDELQGLFHRQPFAAIVIGLAMLSLAGIPPLPGFIAKFLIFREVMAAGHTLVAVLGLVGSYLGIYFYLRVIQAMFMGAPAALSGTQGAATLRTPALVASVLCLLPAIVVAVAPGWIFRVL
ncbi:MAG: NADH-quinone oxidoreductase subunit N [Rubrivivax sp.]|nr:NADH-quinone oxidoreductase subunit N [Rubrivivax sp.]